MTSESGGYSGFLPGVRSQLLFLRDQIHDSGSAALQYPVNVSTVTAFVGINSDGSAWLTIECDPKSVRVDNRSAAIGFAVFDNGYRVTVAPTVNPTTTDNFLEAIVELLNSDHEPGAAAHAALQSWRNLLASAVGPRLSDSSLIGLFGELEILRTILEMGGSLKSWTGWEKDHNDFRLPGLVVEVKTTTSSNFRRVQIHGLGQLDDPEDGSDLVLVLRRLESSPDGKSVPELIDEIIDLGASYVEVFERLSYLHYSDAHRGFYQDQKFVSSDVALRLITDAHPRLVPSRLREIDLSSIDKVDYELNLNSDAESDLDVSLESLLEEHLTK